MVLTRPLQCRRRRPWSSSSDRQQRHPCGRPCGPDPSRQREGRQRSLFKETICGAMRIDEREEQEKIKKKLLSSDVSHKLAFSFLFLFPFLFQLTDRIRSHEATGKRERETGSRNIREAIMSMHACPNRFQNDRSLPTLESRFPWLRPSTKVFKDDWEPFNYYQLIKGKGLE